MSINNRLTDLENAAHPEGPIGVYHDDETVHIGALDTGLTPAEFTAKYPTGTLIHVVYKAGPINPANPQEVWND